MLPHEQGLCYWWEQLPAAPGSWRGAGSPQGRRASSQGPKPAQLVPKLHQAQARKDGKGEGREGGNGALTCPVLSSALQPDQRGQPAAGRLPALASRAINKARPENGR